MTNKYQINIQNGLEFKSLVFEIYLFFEFCYFI